MPERVAGLGISYSSPHADADRSPAALVSVTATIRRTGSLIRLSDGRPVYRLACHGTPPWSRSAMRLRVRLRGRRAHAARALRLRIGETVTLTGRWRNKVFYATTIWVASRPAARQQLTAETR